MTERADFLVNNRSPRYLHGFQKDTNETTELPHTVPVDNQVTYTDSFTNYGVDTVYGKEYVIAAGSSPTVHNSLPGRSDTDTHPASSITNTPAGNIAATTVQAAINELDSEKAQLAAALTNRRVPFANASGFLTDNANFYYITGTGLRITDATASTSTTTGALVVTGGIASGDGIFAGGRITGAATASATGSIFAQPPATTLTSGTIAAFRADLSANPASASSAINIGAFLVASTASGNAQDFTSGIGLNGFFMQVAHNGTGTVTGENGIVAIVDNANAGTVSDLAGARLVARNLGTGTVTRAYGVRVISLVNLGGGTVGTNYGVYVEGQTAGTVNYSIYTNAGLVRLGGQTSIIDTTASTTTATGALVVSGGVGIAGALNVGATIDSNVYTVATLPAGNAGMRAFVSDANATTFASIVAGGGTNRVPVYHDGTNWRIG
jgi:hypothetical protein